MSIDPKADLARSRRGFQDEIGGPGGHEGLPGHGFVLIDAGGQQVWSGDYPSMWIDADQLLGIALDNL